MLSDKTAARDLVAVCKEFSVDQVIFSPGSRNAPLIISFVNNPFFNCISIPDERSAAFFGMGLAQQLKKPVILSCTSGSALLNYSPAIVEAYYQKIPLIIVSSDRPTEWTDQADSQTIRQFEIFKNYIKGSYELIQESDESDDRWANRRKIAEAIELSNNEIPGPVHINIPFREPLYNEIPDSNWNEKVISKVKTETFIPDNVMQGIVDEWNSYGKKLLICGQLPPNNNLSSSLCALLQDETVSILSESTSNIYDEKFNPCIDRVITTFNEDEISSYAPDLVIGLGEAIISKKIKTWIRDIKVKAYWRIGHDYINVDVFKSLTRRIEVPPRQFVDQLNANLNNRESTYQSLWLQKTTKTKQLHDVFLSKVEWSDLKAFESILYKLPSGSHFHMGNSSPVRYVQLFNTRNDLSYYGNRGVSGIDGCTSTAAGASYGEDGIHTIISGDISFVYDSNALWNKHLKSNLKIIVINNQGGGIFRIIPGPLESKLLEEYFECNHPVKIKSLAQAFDMNYFCATNSDELDKNLDKLYASPGNNKPGILEIITPGDKNDRILKDYFSFIKQ
jgi:2-succinyl-5-enolpyruvyl-6-hydroxy-3-cyclohexene-1-carboxylate synthase